MPSLVVPEAGFTLGSSAGGSSKAGSGAPGVFGLTLTDGMIEEMIKCVQNGKPIQLSLGEHPSFSYGTKTQHLATSHDPFTYDLYQSTNSPDSDDADSEMSPFIEKKKNPWFLTSIGQKNKLTPSKGPAKPAARVGPKTSPQAAGGDPAVLALQKANAAEDAKKKENTVTYIKDGSLGMPGKRGGPVKATNKAKFLSQHNRSLTSDTTRSMPSSPALNASNSPSLGPTSIPASTQQLEQAKAARKPVVHLLAVQPMLEKALKDSLPNVSKNDLKQALEKVGDYNDSTQKWELNKKFYKELDVWTFDYNSTADRQRAIDNAVKQFDKMRLGVSEPEWDKLLVKSERGTGKCLSKLQAQIAQGQARAPKIKVQKADGSETPGEDEDLFGDKNLSKVKGEGMARSASQPPTTKTKKVSEKEAQAKRLLSKNPSKAAAKAAPKLVATKKKEVAPPAKTGTKVLSSEFVNESDESDVPTPPPSKPKAKAPSKRPREEEAETSDSSVPLSKKVKKDTPVTNHRISDASQTSRTTNSSTSSYNSSYNSSKNKNTSPHKSSPLASSPPTNASEFENSAGERTSSSASPAHTSTKNSRSPIHKRHQKSSSVTSSSSGASSQYITPAVTDLARKFKMYYPKYETLHKEIAAMAASGKRNHTKEKDLLEMHARLVDMKKAIAAGITDSDSQSN
jgi:RNA polymerase II elongation factor ELL